MKLLVGLGNPGEKYAQNRHNAGFMFADFVAGLHKGSFTYDKYLLSEVSKDIPDIAIAKPQTFMNKSGAAASKLVERYLGDRSAIPSSLIVAHDDLDIPLGKFRIVRGYGPKLHNGIESIEQNLHFNDFLRIRIGVDSRKPGMRIPGLDYVLQNFNGEEKQLLQSQFPAILKLLHSEHGITF